MMKLRLVKGKYSDDAASPENGTSPSDYDSYDTTVVKQLVSPWVVRGERVVAADYGFSSVQPEKLLEDTGLVLIDAIKQA